MNQNNYNDQYDRSMNDSQLEDHDDQYDDQEETEKEAIQLIKFQQEEIARLKQELRDQQISINQMEKTQQSQADTYKGQIINLKKQIELFESKFEQMGDDRGQLDKRLAQITQDNISKIQMIERDKDDLILRLQRDAEKMEQIILQQESQLQKRLNEGDKNSKVRDELKREIKDLQKIMTEKEKGMDNMNLELQQSMQVKVREMDHQYSDMLGELKRKDGDYESKFKTIKKELSASEKNNRQLESRLKDVNEVIHTKNSELKHYQQTLESIEQLQKKAKNDYDKVKRDRDEMKKQRDMYIKDSKPEFEQRIVELEEEIRLALKETEAFRHSRKQADKERNEALRKLQENQRTWQEIQDALENDLKNKSSRRDDSGEVTSLSDSLPESHDQNQSNDGGPNPSALISTSSLELPVSQNPKKIMKNIEPQRVTKFFMEKLDENQKMLAENIHLEKQLESKDKKIKRLKDDIDQTNKQTFQLMQRLSAGCLEDDIETIKVAAASKNNTNSTASYSSQTSSKKQIGTKTKPKSSISNQKRDKKAGVRSKNENHEESKGLLRDDQSEADSTQSGRGLMAGGAPPSFDDLKHSFPQIDPKTIALSAHTMEQINSTLTFLTCENSTLQQQILKMQTELEEAHGVRGEIRGEFDRIKSKVEMAQKWEDESGKLRKRNDFLQSYLSSFNSKYNKLALQSYNSLHNIQFKFQNHQKIQQQVNFARLDQIRDEIQQINSKSSQDQWGEELTEEFSHIIDTIDGTAAQTRDAQIVELISMIGEITNILNFDLKHIDLKDEQIDEMKTRLREVEQQKEGEIMDFKSKINGEISSVKIDYEKKFKEMQTSQKELNQLNQQLMEENQIMCNDLNKKDALFESKAQEIQKINESQKVFKEAIQGLENQIVSQNKQIRNKSQKLYQIRIQKRVLILQVYHLDQNYQNTLQAVGYLSDKYCDKKQERSNSGIPPKLYGSLGIIKLRRAVISIIFVNRLKNRNLLQQDSSSLMAKLNQGLQYVKSKVLSNISQDNIDLILDNKKICNGLIKIFNAKDYYNRKLFGIEEYLSRTDEFKVSQQNQINSQLEKVNGLSENINNQELQFSEMKHKYQEEIDRKDKGLEQLQKKYKQKKGSFKEQYNAVLHELQTQSVPLEEFNRIKDGCSEAQDQLAELAARLKTSKEKTEKIQKEMDELSQEKKELIMKSINSDQELEDVKRDIELKDVKIESLQNIIKKRGFDQGNNSGQIPSQHKQYSEVELDLLKKQMKTLSDKLGGLENQREKMIQDNILLINENESLKSRVNDLEKQIGQQDKQMLQKNSDFMINQENLMQKSSMVHNLELRVKELEENNRMLEQQIMKVQDSKVHEQMNDPVLFSDKQINKQINMAEQMINDSMMKGTLDQEHIKEDFAPNDTNNFNMGGMGNLGANLGNIPVNMSYQSNVSRTSNNSQFSTTQNLVPGKIVRRSGAPLAGQRSSSRGASGLKLNIVPPSLSAQNSMANLQGVSSTQRSAMNLNFNQMSMRQGGSSSPVRTTTNSPGISVHSPIQISNLKNRANLDTVEESLMNLSATQNTVPPEKSQGSEPQIKPSALFFSHI